MAEWEIQANLSIRCVVFVDAETAADALSTFNDGRWLDDTRMSGELFDWEPAASPVRAP